MAWRRPGDKPLSEPTMVSLLTHICVTRPQWVKVWDDISSLNTLRCRYNEVNFLPNIHNIHQIDRPWRRYMGASFVSSLTELWSAVDIVVLYVISYHIRPRYNDTRLYKYDLYHKRPATNIVYCTIGPIIFQSSYGLQCNVRHLFVVRSPIFFFRIEKLIKIAFLP